MNKMAQDPHEKNIGTCITAPKIAGAIHEELTPSGLDFLGWFRAENHKPALLIGNVGSRCWPAFSSSVYFRTGQPEAMNSWTQNTLLPIAEHFNAEIRFPFGEKIWPFQAYAKKAMGVEQSPIGMLIHPDYGLWFALRAVFVFSQNFDIPEQKIHKHPCATCIGKPCLTTCPVAAFTVQGYEVEKCRAHLRTNHHLSNTAKGPNTAQNQCLIQGCSARAACPVGQEWKYNQAQRYFHMSAFKW